jgi:hypothetical protein
MIKGKPSQKPGRKHETVELIHIVCLSNIRIALASTAYNESTRTQMQSRFHLPVRPPPVKRLVGRAVNASVIVTISGVLIISMFTLVQSACAVHGYIAALMLQTEELRQI